jgi:hypothetical protein
MMTRYDSLNGVLLEGGEGKFERVEMLFHFYWIACSVLFRVENYYHGRV